MAGRAPQVREQLCQGPASGLGQQREGSLSSGSGPRAGGHPGKTLGWAKVKPVLDGAPEGLRGRMGWEQRAAGSGGVELGQRALRKNGQQTAGERAGRQEGHAHTSGRSEEIVILAGRWMWGRGWGR